jgi:hypothetical protein
MQYGTQLCDQMLVTCKSITLKPKLWKRLALKLVSAGQWLSKPKLESIASQARIAEVNALDVRPAGQCLSKPKLESKAPKLKLESIAFKAQARVNSLPSSNRGG